MTQMDFFFTAEQKDLRQKVRLLADQEIEPWVREEGDIEYFQLIRSKLANMATELTAGRLLVYQAAWLLDRRVARTSLESSMAKYYATEMAQRVVDQSQQVHGGLGVTVGSVVERLYREVRGLRLYEGTSEIQQIVIAGQVLKG